jgi:hypothetical protein
VSLAKKTDAPTAEVVLAYKAFDANWQCRGFQYEVGQTYEHAGHVEACSSGFHACEYPLDVLRYYPPAGSKFAAVEQSGQIARHDDDTKVASSRISIKAEIDLPLLIKAAIEWTFSRSKPEGETATGYSGAASATGDSGAASATGYSGAASATGDSGAASATGGSGAASATGERGAASATGDSGAASATGYSGAAMATGRYGRAMGAEGCALFLVERDAEWKIVAVWSGIVGRDGIKAGVWYTLDGGKLVEAA